jgi:hypothetical protein
VASLSPTSPTPAVAGQPLRNSTIDVDSANGLTDPDRARDSDITDNNPLTNTFGPSIGLSHCTTAVPGEARDPVKEMRKVESRVVFVVMAVERIR